MTRVRQAKAEAIIHHLASEFFLREAHSGTSLITVTHADMSEDLKNATIFITVLPEDKEMQALEFCKRQLGAFRDFAAPQLSLRTIPYFRVELDAGERNRQRVEELI